MENRRKQRRVALFVGVDNYPEDAGIHPLRCAVEDAKAFCAHIRTDSKFDRDNVQLLENPTTREVVQTAAKLRAGLGPGDFFLFYFAGHGVTDSHGEHRLVCRDSIYVEDADLINTLSLSSVVGRKNACHRAVVLDACRTPLKMPNERAVGGESVAVMRDLALGSLQQFIQSEACGEGTSLSILCSCDKGKSAGEIADLGHGLFTQALLDVLSSAKKHFRQVLFGGEFVKAIAAQMKTLATQYAKYQEQMPWFQSNNLAETPELASAGLDVRPFQKVLLDLAGQELISQDTKQRCERELLGEGTSAVQQGVIEACNLFMGGSQIGPESAAGAECAATLLSAMGDSAMQRLREENSRLTAQLHRAEGKLAEMGGAVPRSGEQDSPLGYEEREMLSKFCTGVTSPPGALGAVRSSQTEGEAVSALNKLSLDWVETYGRGNARGRGPIRSIPVRVTPEGQALATELRNVGDSVRTPLQKALLLALNAALSLGGRV
ncbi:MAG: caspase family protein [Kiritimatiellae bacterium]|nr:caspase family protein [Kiritimatiellia bacterium]